MIRVVASMAALVAALALAACGPPRPDAAASMGSGGAQARAGVEAGGVRAGAGTSGPYAEADVVRTPNTRVTVGTGGVGASVGAGPVRIGIGSGGWWGLGVGL